MSTNEVVRTIEPEGYTFRLPETALACDALGSSPSLAQFEDTDRALVVSTYRRAGSLPGRLGLAAATGAVEAAFEAKGPLVAREETGDETRVQVTFTGGVIAESRVTVVALRLADGQVAMLEVTHPIGLGGAVEGVVQAIVGSLEPRGA